MESVSGKSLAEMSAQQLDEWIDQRVAASIIKQESEKTPRLSIMVTKGTLDWAYPPFIIASTAAALPFLTLIFLASTPVRTVPPLASISL